jgi:hypothetical protein
MKSYTRDGSRALPPPVGFHNLTYALTLKEHFGHSQILPL